MTEPATPRPQLRPNPLGVAVAGVGVVLGVLGGLVLDWVRPAPLTLYDFFEWTWDGGFVANSVEAVVRIAYQGGLAYLLLAVTAYHALMITTGRVGTRTGALATFGRWGPRTLRRRDGVARLRLAGAVVGVVALGLHVWGVLAVSHLDLAFMAAGPWVLLAAAVTFPVACAIGPAHGPREPRPTSTSAPAPWNPRPGAGDS